MVTLSGVAKRFGGRALFSEVSLQINLGDRIGLVGPNGAGKSTLLSLILGTQEPDEGTISLERNTSLGYLPQESAPAGDATVLEMAMAINPEMDQLQRAVKAAGDGNETGDHADHLGHDAHDRFVQLGGYELEPKAKRILSGLSFREQDFHRPAREMSGGWVMRAYLARLLVQEPDLLILDEPTNHLDLEALQWFQEYLKLFPGAILMISHDREFLNQLCGSIVEIRREKIFRYRGNYDDYLAQREAQALQNLAAYKNQQREIARLQEFADRFRAKASKAAQAQSKLKQIERMDLVEAPDADDKKIHFQFPQPVRSGLKVITLTGVRHAYGQNVVYENLDFEAERGQRVVLVGPNGAGKSTLLKVLAGVLPVQAGTRELGYQAKAGYYSQYRVEMLQAGRTVFEEALDTPQRVTEQSVRTLLGCFLFRGDDVFKRVSVLSGGEKSRLALVKLLLDPPNLLLMDEPTTHLDMPSIDALVEALKQFQGALIFISHDVYFIRALAGQVVRVQAGRLTRYLGDYQYYLDKISATSARAALVAGDAPARAPVVEKERIPDKHRKRAEAEERQARSKGRRERQRAVEALENQIAESEKKRAALVVALEAPETYQSPGKPVEINRELTRIEETIARLTRDWEQASAQMVESEQPVAVAVEG
jgi:ATP-binding cassette subfamily F protein 3